ncbi:hypothetical protein CAEBREN_18933 [Caenorhabditis brenneri]|uniref:Uncharacterized protein n=1 Tax=Caenorhabditis brenneri TaxID=135651 RepID=G0MGN1_CAEBE|nr:hypothetical protein CAEBREN_18933 [Caenorhabditis brenneri]
MTSRANQEKEKLCCCTQHEIRRIKKGMKSLEVLWLKKSKPKILVKTVSTRRSQESNRHSQSESDFHQKLKTVVYRLDEADSNAVMKSSKQDPCASSTALNELLLIGVSSGWCSVENTEMDRAATQNISLCQTFHEQPTTFASIVSLRFEESRVLESIVTRIQTRTSRLNIQADPETSKSSELVKPPGPIPRSPESPV